MEIGCPISIRVYFGLCEKRFSPRPFCGERVIEAGPRLLLYKQFLAITRTIDRWAEAIAYSLKWNMMVPSQASIH
uniref:Uncharacterized protein n=1 Tax=Picea sitchensis TaxID=3332 RepID=A0A6B9XW75_PICSI|nr:hypothetical protein Q903MT_gene5596 [Picea sitchensis]